MATENEIEENLGTCFWYPFKKVGHEWDGQIHLFRSASIRHCSCSSVHTLLLNTCVRFIMSIVFTMFHFSSSTSLFLLLLLLHSLLTFARKLQSDGCTRAWLRLAGETESGWPTARLTIFTSTRVLCLAHPFPWCLPCLHHRLCSIHPILLSCHFVYF